MRGSPPEELASLLGRLNLATPKQVRSMAGRARRLAGELPLLDSIWVDALVQARLLTPYQGSELNSGRGEQLVVGPYRIARPIQRLGNADCFLAIESPSRGDQDSKSAKEIKEAIHLLVARRIDPDTANRAAARLQRTLEQFPADTKIPNRLLRPLAVGCSDDVIWASYAPARGVPIGQHLAWHGRLSPGVVLDIGRQLASALAALEYAGIVHGEIAASSLWLDRDGEIQLARAGWSHAINNEWRNPAESALEDFDYLPPERLPNADGRAHQGPVIAADIYSYGCLLWHLLAGRTPFAGGDVASKCRAICRARLPDIRQIAPDVAPKLAGLIDQCMRREPVERPQSFAAVVEHLGVPVSAPRREVVNFISRTNRTMQRRWNRLGNGAKRSARAASAMAACAALVLIATWPMWRARSASRPLTTTNNSSIASTKKPSQSQDAGVRLANYQTPAEKSTNSKSRQAAPPTVPVIELPAGAQIAAVTIRLVPHAVVRSAGDGRATIAVPANGWAISSEDVHFENVDFLWRQRAEQITSPETHSIIDLRAASAEFTGCTFQAVASEGIALPSAIRLSGVGNRSTLVPATRVRVTRSVFRSVAEGTDCRSRGPAAIELVNTLHLGRGPLIRIPESRPPDAPMNIVMEHVTLRGATCAVELNSDSTGEPSGSISVNATACVFAPDSSGALVVVDDRRGQSVSLALKSIDWSGQESLIVPETSVAIARSPAGDKAIADGELALEGIVASALEFSDQAGNRACTSQVQKWLAPLRTDEPPGIAGDLPAVPNFPQFVTAATK